jgi:hypothetical protein
MAGITAYFSTITVNVNGLSCPIKRHRLEDLIKNKIQPFLVYKKCTTLSKTSTGLK